MSLRARNIKPGFFQNETLAELPFSTRLLFLGLWLEADREGRLEDRPKRITAELFPYDRDIDLDGGLVALERTGFITRYQVQGLRLIQVLKFKRHQSPHHTEKKSILPAPPVDSKSTVTSPLVHGESKQGSPSLNGENPSDSLIHRFSDSPKPDSLKRTPSSEQQKGSDRDGNQGSKTDTTNRVSTTENPTPVLKAEDQSELVMKLWHLYPANRHRLNELVVPQADSIVIIHALARDGEAVVLRGTLAYLTAVSKWPAHERKFVPKLVNWFNESQYRKDPAEWERGNTPAGELEAAQTSLPNPAEIARRRRSELMNA